jgi:hypothetical protein
MPVDIAGMARACKCEGLQRRGLQERAMPANPSQPSQGAFYAPKTSLNNQSFTGSLHLLLYRWAFEVHGMHPTFTQSPVPGLPHPVNGRAQRIHYLIF